jgi:hypothetical protein
MCFWQQMVPQDLLPCVEIENDSEILGGYENEAEKARF